MRTVTTEGTDSPRDFEKAGIQVLFGIVHNRISVENVR